MRVLEGKLTTREAANKYGLTQNYIRRLCNEGRLTFTRVVTVLLVDKSSLDAYVKEVKAWKAERAKSKRSVANKAKALKASAKDAQSNKTQ